MGSKKQPAHGYTPPKGRPTTTRDEVDHGAGHVSKRRYRLEWAVVIGVVIAAFVAAVIWGGGSGNFTGGGGHGAMIVSTFL